MTKVETQVELLTKAIEKLIANPVAPIAPVAPVAPVLPIVQQYNGDHDLLQRVDEKLTGLTVIVNKIAARDDLFVLKEDFVFWRNLLVLSLLATIAAGVITRFLIK